MHFSDSLMGPEAKTFFDKTDVIPHFGHDTSLMGHLHFALKRSMLFLSEALYVEA